MFLLLDGIFSPLSIILEPFHSKISFMPFGFEVPCVLKILVGT